MLQRIDSILVSGGGVFLIKGTGEVADLLESRVVACHQEGCPAGSAGDRHRRGLSSTASPGREELRSVIVKLLDRFGHFARIRSLKFQRSNRESAGCLSIDSL